MNVTPLTGLQLLVVPMAVQATFILLQTDESYP